MALLLMYKGMAASLPLALQQRAVPHAWRFRGRMSISDRGCAGRERGRRRTAPARPAGSEVRATGRPTDEASDAPDSEAPCEWMFKAATDAGPRVTTASPVCFAPCVHMGQSVRSVSDGQSVKQSVSLSASQSYLVGALAVLDSDGSGRLLALVLEL